ncbi:coiled-coil domain-containing protein 43 [Planococcus citri]|uniref:coiled-coil domain-containing protein 43 n=1 Tax=Planococcus citri TaxID=170843 RepID=UPI0031FA46F6
MAQSEEKHSGFSSWLSGKLDQLKIDENIYLNYIISILEGDESRDEKLDILTSILVDTGSSEEFICSCCNEILDNWQTSLSSASEEKKTEKVVENVDQKLARLLESNVRLGETTHACTYTDEQLKIREAILSQYGHGDELEDDYEDDEKDDDLEKNTNASAIHQAEKEKREKAKLENQKKKERDKLEREKQKSTLQEKKEARRKRAQKVEHHRK